MVGGIGASADASASALAGSTSTSTKGAFEAACRSLARWDDLALDKHWQLCVGRLRSKGRWGLALKRVNELVASNADNKTKDGIQREALLEVGYIVVLKNKIDPKNSLAVNADFYWLMSRKVSYSH